MVDLKLSILLFADFVHILWTKISLTMNLSLCGKSHTGNFCHEMYEVAARKCSQIRVYSCHLWRTPASYFYDGTICHVGIII